MFDVHANDQQHLQDIQALIRAEIEKTGPLSFERYMSLALYTPNLGYYRARRPKFGKAGDFITAPEISPLFSQCLAQQCLSIREALPTFSVLELGAGSGKMAYDLLQTLAALDALPEKYFILEISGSLQQTQKEKIHTLPTAIADRVEWLTQLPTGFTGVILANEVIDAMPVHRFRVDEQGIHEFYVTFKEAQFHWQTSTPSTPDLTKAIQDLNLQPLPYESEINLFLPAWINSLGACLKQGVILLIDYGFPRHEFYHPDRTMGTLMCHYHHQAHSDPLILTGLQDITVHVDFTQVAESALHAHLEVLGFTNQAAFLLNLHLLDFLEAAMAAHPAQQTALAHQVKRLTLPTEMGELFKVMALGKGLDIPLQGFATQDQRQRL